MANVIPIILFFLRLSKAEWVSGVCSQNGLPATVAEIEKRNLLEMRVKYMKEKHRRDGICELSGYCLLCMYFGDFWESGAESNAPNFDWLFQLRMVNNLSMTASFSLIYNTSTPISSYCVAHNSFPLIRWYTESDSPSNQF